MTHISKKKFEKFLLMSRKIVWVFPFLSNWLRVVGGRILRNSMGICSGEFRLFLRGGGFSKKNYIDFVDHYFK